MRRPTADEIGRALGGDAIDFRNCLIAWGGVMTLVTCAVLW